MSNTKKIIFIVLMLATLALMFVPVAKFHDNSADSLAADITKQEKRVQSEKDKLDRWKEAGTHEKDYEKQEAKIVAAQEELDALIAKSQEASDESASLSYALLPGKLPSEIQMDTALLNQTINTATGDTMYPQDLTPYYVMLRVIAGLIIVSVVLVVLAGSKPASKLYTFSGFTHLIALLLMVYCILRLQSIPVKLPYGNPEMNTPVVIGLLLFPLAAFALHIGAVWNTKRSMIYVFCTFLSILALIPFWIMIVNATRTSTAISQGVSLIPSNAIHNNWMVIQKTKNFDVLLGMRNSAIISFGSTILGVYFSALTAYGFEVYHFKGRKFLWAVVMAIIMIPGQVTGTGFTMFMYRLKLTNNFIPLVVPAIASAATVFFFKQYLEANFQISLVEASRIDGAGEFFTFNRIILPIMVPAMATMGIMAMIGSWNNFLTPLMLLTKAELKTLPILVNNLRGDVYRTQFGSIYLGLTLTALPLMIVYFAFSKYIIAGVALGGVKE